jgi:hypothetical protein
MTWETPKLVEVQMSAEIGAYQDDTDRDEPIIVAEETSEAE